VIQARTRSLRVVLLEGSGAEPLADGERTRLLAALLDGGFSVSRRGAAPSPTPEPVALLGRFGADVATPEPPAHLVPLDGDGPEGVIARLDALQARLELPAPREWLPWFPVIDYQRCTNCMQCLSFCLFDVYGVDANGQIEVRNEEKCKTNCPACSRVCPEVAILFPKYKKGPINGDEVRAEDVQREAMKVDISALLGGDIYSALRDRKDAAKKRFSTERDESKALLERKRCLKELGQQLDIPDEVLMSLPSAGEIEERARRAKEKHEARMARSQTERDRRGPITPQEWGI